MRTRIRLIGLLVPLFIGILTVTSPAYGTINLWTQSPNGLFFDVFVDLVDPDSTHPPDPGVDLRSSTHPLFTLNDVKNARFFLSARLRGSSRGLSFFETSEPSDPAPLGNVELRPSPGEQFPVESFFDVTFDIDFGGASFTWKKIDPIGGPGSLGIEFNATNDPPFTIGMQFLDPITKQAATFHVAAIPEPETYAMLLAGLGLLGFAARRTKLKEAALA